MTYMGRAGEAIVHAFASGEMAARGRTIGSGASGIRALSQAFVPDTPNYRTLFAT